MTGRLGWVPNKIRPPDQRMAVPHGHFHQGGTFHVQHITVDGEFLLQESIDSVASCVGEKTGHCHHG